MYPPSFQNQGVRVGPGTKLVACVVVWLSLATPASAAGVVAPVPQRPEARAALLAAAFRPETRARSFAFDGATSAPARFRPSHGQPVFGLRIPAIGLREMVVEGADQPALAANPGHYPECGPEFPAPYCSNFDAPWPGERGRVVVGGHRTLETRPFFDLGELRSGDRIIVRARWGRFLYRVTRARLVSPLDRTIIVPGVRRRELVLVTCHPKFSAAQRLLIFAELQPPRATQRAQREPPAQARNSVGAM
ncbi:MAG: sortase [Actinomycetota bacterium]